MALLVAGPEHRAQRRCNGGKALALSRPHLDGRAGIKVNGDLYPLNVFFADYGFNGKKVTDRLHPSLMGPLQGYQDIVYTQGPLLLVCLAGAVAVGVRLRRSRAHRRHARWAALLWA